MKFVADADSLLTFEPTRHLLREAKQEHLKATRIDFYALLGLEKTAGDSEIKKAYFKKSKEFHPDRYRSSKVGHK